MNNASSNSPTLDPSSSDSSTGIAVTQIAPSGLPEAIVSHYESFAEGGVTHLFRCANADSRSEMHWRKMWSPSAETLSHELQSLSGSRNARVPSDWPYPKSGTCDCGSCHDHNADEAY